MSKAERTGQRIVGRNKYGRKRREMNECMNTKRVRTEKIYQL
jgi:hypothetical protein